MQPTKPLAFLSLFPSKLFSAPFSKSSTQVRLFSVISHYADFSRTFTWLGTSLLTVWTKFQTPDFNLADTGVRGLVIFRLIGICGEVIVTVWDRLWVG